MVKRSMDLYAKSGREKQARGEAVTDYDAGLSRLASPRTIGGEFGMNFNLTTSQKDLARWIYNRVKQGQLLETFRVSETRLGIIWIEGLGDLQGVTDLFDWSCVDTGTFEALISDGLLLRTSEQEEAITFGGVRRIVTRAAMDALTVTGRFYQAIEGNFSDQDRNSIPISTLAHAAPPELNLSLDRLRKNFPDAAKLGFLIMRFTKGKAFEEIVSTIKSAASKHGIAIVRADDHEFHSELWGNVRTLLHGCSFGIAVYERIESDEHNANVGLEVGYLLAMNKPVLLLKEKTVKTLQADLMGKLYKAFDEHDAAGTIPNQLTKWLVDNGVVLNPK
jgi:hypothetical protein